MRMKASNLIPLLLAGFLWCLTFTCLAFIAFRTVQTVLKKLATNLPLLVKPLARLHARLVFSRRPRRRSARDIDIELQELPPATLEDYSETSRPARSDRNNFGEPSSIPFSTMTNNQASFVIPYRMPWIDEEDEDDDLFRLPPPLLREPPRAAQQTPLRRVVNNMPFISNHRPRLGATTDVMGTGMDVGIATTSHAVAGNEEEITSRWLTSPRCPPKSYSMYHIARSRILSSKYRCEVLFSPPEAEAACKELLDVVLAELRMYELGGKKRSVRELLLEKSCLGAGADDRGGAKASDGERRAWRLLTRCGGGGEQGRVVKNKIMGEDIVVGGELGVDPLEAVAKLILEDVGLFMKGAGEDGEEWRLVAGAAIFPSGWRLLDRIGQPGHHASGFSLPLRGREVVTDAFTRHFIHIAREPLYDSDTIDEKAQCIAKLLFVQAPKDFFCGEVHAELDRIVVRKERHSMRLLPKSNAMAVAVRTTVQPLRSMSNSDLDELESEMDGWSAQTMNARGHWFWGKPVRSYLEARRKHR